MDLIEIHKKKLPLFTKIIEGFLAYNKYADLELSLIDTENRNEIDKWLDSKKSIQQLLKNYENAAKASEDFLTQKGIDVDYSWIEMTRDEWEKHKKWEYKFLLPYLKKEHPIIHFFKSIKNKTLWQKRKEIRPPVFIRSATWLQSQPNKSKK